MTTGSPGRPATSTSDDLPDAGEAFDRGYEAGMHPRLDDRWVGGVAITTTLSTWLGLSCGTCRHTFRVGDRVVVVDDVDRTVVRHLDPVLACAVAPDVAEEPMASAGLAASEEVSVANFARGLLEAWPTASGVPRRLAADDWRVPRRGSRRVAGTCKVCAHTFRPGDMVVICPCAAQLHLDTPRCQFAVHRDPVVGLTCWDDWCPTGELKRCPVTREPPR